MAGLPLSKNTLYGILTFSLIPLLLIALVILSSYGSGLLGADTFWLSITSVITLLVTILINLYQTSQIAESRIAEKNLTNKIIKVTDKMAELHIWGATSSYPPLLPVRRAYEGLKEQLDNLQKALETVKTEQRQSDKK